MYSFSRIYSEDLCPLARERYDESNTDCRDDHPKPGNYSDSTTPIYNLVYQADDKYKAHSFS